MLSQNQLNFDSYWDVSDPSRTEKRFREIMIQIPEKDPAFLELLTQIAHAQGLQQKFKKAHLTLDQVEKRLKPFAVHLKARCVLERGRLLSLSGNPDEARLYLEDALEIAASIIDTKIQDEARQLLSELCIPIAAMRPRVGK